MDSQILPHNLDAEIAVLGAAFLCGETFLKVKAEMSPRDFYNVSHQKIYAAFKSLSDRSEPIDLLTVSEELKRGGHLETIGGTDFLSELEEGVATAAQALHHAKIIREKRHLRDLIRLSHDLQQAAYRGDGDAVELIAHAQKALESMATVPGNGRVSINHVYDAGRLLESYREYVQTLQGNLFVTGIGEIDKRIRGVAGGEVLTIIARAGSFKTALLQNLLKNYIKHSAWGAVFFSLEMPTAAVCERFQSMQFGMGGHDIEKAYADIHPDDPDFKFYQNRFAEEFKNLFVIPVKVNLPDIAAYVRLIEKKKGLKIGVIGIDYIGLIDAPGSNEYEAISRVAREIKNTAKALNIPLILLSQVSRKGGDGQEEITLDMARGSGAIEEAADFVLGLWQQETGTTSGGEPVFDLICKILKNRKGPSGSRWKLDLDPKTFKIGGDAVAVETQKKNGTKITY